MSLRHFDVIREILDKQLLDRDDNRMGRIDGVVLEVLEDGPPRVDHFELGFIVLARRLHPKLESWFASLRRWSVRRSARQIVPWSAVTEVTQHHVKLNVEVDETPAFDWERWLRKNVVEKLPGGKEE